MDYQPRDFWSKRSEIVFLFLTSDMIDNPSPVNIKSNANVLIQYLLHVQEEIHSPNYNKILIIFN